MQLEAMVSQITDWQANAVHGEGNRRNGYRERGLLTSIGKITLHILEPRAGTYFPDELTTPYSRVDRAMVAVVKGAYARGLSTRKTGKATDTQDLVSRGPHPSRTSGTGTASSARSPTPTVALRPAITEVFQGAA